MESNISNKGRLTTLFMHYFGAVLLFMLEKPLFMVFAGGLRHHYSIKEWILVIWHGIPIDLSVAGYLTLFPLLVILTCIWIQSSGVLNSMHPCCSTSRPQRRRLPAYHPGWW